MHFRIVIAFSLFRWPGSFGAGANSSKLSQSQALYKIE